MKSIKVAEHMNKRPLTFLPEMTIAQASERILQSHQIGGPVLDPYKHVIGFLSEQDCLMHMLEDTYQGESHATVMDIMQTETLTIGPEESVLDVAQRMTGNKPKIYPVVDENNRLAGILSRTDVLKAIDVHLHAMYEKGHARLV